MSIGFVQLEPLGVHQKIATADYLLSGSENREEQSQVFLGEMLVVSGNSLAHHDNPRYVFPRYDHVSVRGIDQEPKDFPKLVFYYC